MNYLLIPPDEIQDNHIVIHHPVQVNHLTKVLKVQQGDTVKIAVLGGKLGTAEVDEIDAQAIRLSKIQTTQRPPNKLPITLVVAMPRPKVLRRLILDAVAMGIKAIYIIHSYRVEKSYWQSPHLTKLDNYVHQGLEQAGDCIAPEIHLKKRFKPFVEDELPALIQDKTALVAHPKTDQLLSHMTLPPEQDIVLLLGAEGGFIPYEVDLLTQQGCHVVSMGQRILRTENALAMLVGYLSATAGYA